MKHLLFLAIVAISLTSCRSISTHEVEKSTEIRTDTLRVMQLQRDSVYLHDSIFVKEYQRGDTIFVTKHVYNTAYRDRIRRDTVYRSKTDTVRVSESKEVEKERTAFPWRRIYEVAFCIVAIASGIGCIYILAKKT